MVMEASAVSVSHILSKVHSKIPIPAVTALHSDYLVTHFSPIDCDCCDYIANTALGIYLMTDVEIRLLGT